MKGHILHDFFICVTCPERADLWTEQIMCFPGTGAEGRWGWLLLLAQGFCGGWGEVF